jgi:hypothetical protein
MMKRQHGNVLTEYGLLLGLLALASVGGLTFMGNSTANLMGQNTNNLNGRSVQDLVSLNFGKSGKTTNNPSASTVLNPTVAATGTAAASLPLTSGSSGETNTTSTEGGRKLLTYESLSQADTVMQIAAASTDPATKDWANNVAKYLYWMGGAEGSFSGISQLAIPTNKVSTSDSKGNTNSTTYAYTQDNALKDLKAYNAALQKLLANPPTSASSADIAQVTSLSQESSNTANQFIQTGVTNTNFVTVEAQKRGIQAGLDGNGNLGQNYTQTYDQLVSYDTLKANTATVLKNSDYQQQAPDTYSTLQNAQTVDTQASGTTSTPPTSTP